MGVGERGARGMQCEVGGQFAGGGDMAFADTGPLHDPFVGGFHRLCQFVVAEDPRRQIAAATQHHRTQYRHEIAPVAMRPVALACKSRAINSPILASNS